ncbi:DnaJ domain-containing protein [Halorubrum ezzemoulense]|uniref:DnaJ domain-containing protein n=1 Tax=Halorubrum ezzemoulense TaxID=337243 RepID=A0A256JYE8_HALEZ|nr:MULTISPECIES: J domain-containing protein [Halorubrum]MDB2236662.1 J domain-containing protein [Halorubrum ezzemoulense]MDB2247349.1 J domain-containing protein [Halorubrum ezzemoulense]MDB2281907.1 J domain-containing protein [Halorubrum ezzemoulense]OTF01247.1 molecular chaperone DnaJ [Halorubrum sp. SD612]OYR63847.1 molecular chaperone DnaJ [Halorubrum ezzemoulense]
MFAEFTSLVPRWVLWGVGLGGVATAVVAFAFYLGDRFVPAPAASTGGRGAAGDDRRRREIRTYLNAAGERFDEDHAFDGVSVPFYLPDRGVAITFDAHDYFRLEGEGVYTVLCEHEMPGRGLGRRLPFDVDEPDWATDDSSGSDGGRSGAGGFGGRFGADRAAGRSTARGRAGRADPVGDAFDELGLDRDADVDAVKGAYRERVKETHPDQGGDEESFRRVREAYATARNHADGGPSPGGGDADRDAGRRRERSSGYGR